MLAVTSTFEMAELARSEARGFEDKRASLGRVRPFISWFVSYPISVLADFVVDKIDGVARDLAGRAVWFRGARDEVCERPLSKPLDPSLELVELLDEMESHVSGLRDATLDIVNRRARKGAKRASLTQALQRVADASAELIREVDGFREAVLAFEGRRCSLGEAATEYFVKNDPVFCRLMDSRSRMQSRVASFSSQDVSDLDEELLEEARLTVAAADEKHSRG